MIRVLISRLGQALGDMSIRWQIVLLLIVSQFLAHAIAVVAVSVLVVSEEQRDQLRVDISDVFIGILTTIGAEDSHADSPAIAAIAAQDDRFVRDLSFPLHLREDDRIADLVRAELPLGWRDRVRAFDLGEDAPFPGPRMEPFVLAAELTDGDILLFYPSQDVLARTFPIIALVLSLAIFAVPLALVALWAGTFLTAPVARLAAGAKRFSDSAEAEVIAATGAREVRSAIETFNMMQRKLRQLIDDPAQTLAAIGHDMRTPLTRLRLRLENVELGDATEGVERDIAALEVMIDDALEFLRSESRRVDLGPVDLKSLCETATSDFSDRGFDVSFATKEKINVICDITLTLRSLNNIIQNAVKYAGSAVVTLEENREEASVDIRVFDNGPGIPEALIATVRKPFNRLPVATEPAPKEPKGFGLGLAVAAECMERQGGQLLLERNSPTGLVATLRLPTMPAA